MHFSTENLRALSDFQSWNEGGEAQQRISIFDYLCFNATPDLLFAFASLFFCELVEIEEFLFIKERFGESEFEAWKSKTSDMRTIQRVMNHVHMRSLFQGQEVGDSVARACAHLIKDAWEKNFKDRSMVAEVHGETFEELSVTLVAASK